MAIEPAGAGNLPTGFAEKLVSEVEVAARMLRPTGRAERNVIFSQLRYRSKAAAQWSHASMAQH